MTDKEILILGGGDGGLLHELLKESPKFVTMVDIDGRVMFHCAQHLRGACGSDLDNWNGPNYQVIEGDCLEFMKNCAQEKRTFDVVFNDLTDIPIEDNSKDGDNLALWDFIKKILELALPLVRPDGKYLNHAIGKNAVREVQAYENVLDNLPIKVQYKSHTAWVPSFVEDWVFYEVIKV